MIKGQKKKHSLLEVVINTIIGYLIACFANYYLLPLWGYKVSVQDSMTIAILFTIISVLRGYLLRRLFNLLHVYEIM